MRVAHDPRPVQRQRNLGADLAEAPLQLQVMPGVCNHLGTSFVEIGHSGQAIPILELEQRGDRTVSASTDLKLLVSSGKVPL